MKFAPALISGITLLSFGYSSAAVTMPNMGATLSLTLSTTVSGGAFASLPTTTVFDTGTTQTGTTHMIVGPMTLSPTGKNVYAGSYEMINASTGAAVSTGIVNFTMASSDDYVGSRKVVGVIPLSGGLTNSGITLATGTGTLEGANATVAYNTDISVMQVTIGSTVSDVPYIATNESTIVFEAPFWISNGASTVKFSAGYAQEQADGSYLGMLTPADGSSTYVVTLDDPNDSDSDKIANITDPDNYWYSGSTCYNGSVYSSWLGWFNFYYPPLSSGSWDNYSIAAHSYIWHYDHGFLYTRTVWQDGEKWLYIFDTRMGWLATNENLYPYLYAYEVVLNGVNYGASWLFYREGSGATSNRVFFAQTGNLSTSSNVDSIGWWAIPGANAQ